MQNNEILLMHDRLRKALSNPIMRDRIVSDITNTLASIGVDYRCLESMVRDVEESISGSLPLEANETRIYSNFNRITTVDGETMLDALEKKMAGRAEIIFGQVAHFFHDGQSIIDWGCGDGRVTSLIQKRVAQYIEGYDIRSYPALGISSKINIFDGAHVDVPDGYFDAGLMTNVAHHEKDNQKILTELSRIIRHQGRLVVIETVPKDNTPEELERTFFADYFYNRMLHLSDIPVPGTYETVQGWVDRFEKVGFYLENLDGTENPYWLGVDHPIIPDHHVLYVFKRE